MSSSSNSPVGPSVELKGRTAIITGSGRNIGRAVALAFARSGANVVINGHSNQAAVDEVVREAKELGAAAIGVMADVSDPAEVEQLVRTTSDHFGPVDIAVTNVGIRVRQAFEDITVEDWQRVLRTNLDAAFYMARCVAPMMRDAGWGRIVHVSGYDGWTGHIDQRAHNVTAKAGLHGLTKALARELGPYGVTVNTVAPGAIDTERDPEQYRHIDRDAIMARLAIKHPGHVDDIAQACAYLVGPNSGFVTGQVIHVNGGEFMF